jgi:hypothetical protein
MPSLALLLAQADAPPADIGSWLANAAYLALLAASILGGLVALKNLREKPSETPQPFTVKTAEQFATQQQLTEVHGRIKRERLEIDKAIADVRTEYRDTSERIDAELRALREQLAGNNEAGEARAEKLHNRINAVLEASAEMRGEMRSFIAAAKRG